MASISLPDAIRLVPCLVV